MTAKRECPLCHQPSVIPAKERYCYPCWSNIAVCHECGAEIGDGPCVVCIKR